MAPVCQTLSYCLRPVSKFNFQSSTPVRFLRKKMKTRTVVVGEGPPALARSEKLHCERFACGVRVTSLRLALVAFYCVVSPLKPSHVNRTHIVPFMCCTTVVSWEQKDFHGVCTIILVDIPLLLNTGWIVAVSQCEMINQSINHHALPPPQPCDTSHAINTNRGRYAACTANT